MKKTIIAMVIVLCFITGAGVGAVWYLTKDKNANQEPTASQLANLTVTVPEITTNLKDDSYVKVTFTLVAEDKNGKNEATQRMFEIQDVITKELANNTASEIEGGTNMKSLEDRLKTGINGIMKVGKIRGVYATAFLVQ